MDVFPPKKKTVWYFPSKVERCHFFVKENNSESPRRSTNDSPTESVNGSLRPVDSSDSPTKSANGSLSQQKTVCSPSNWQMAVFSQEKTVCLLNTQEIDKWQFLQTVCLFLGCLVPHRVDEWQFSS